jgi:hypothetical protein
MTSLKHRLVGRGAVILGALLTMLAVFGVPAQAAPIQNTVSELAFIWNCPVQAPGCFPGAQTRVGDVRVNEPLLDVCTYSSGDRQQNLVFNRTSRGGAAERTGFLYRSFLNSDRQIDTCTGGGLQNSASGDVDIQRLCPYFSCGRTGDIDGFSVLRDFCRIISDGTEWRLIVAFDNTGGPLTAGFVPREGLNPFIEQGNECNQR